MLPALLLSATLATQADARVSCEGVMASTTACVEQAQREMERAGAAWPHDPLARTSDGCSTCTAYPGGMVLCTAVYCGVPSNVEHEGRRVYGGKDWPRGFDYPDPDLSWGYVAALAVTQAADAITTHRNLGGDCKAGIELNPLVRFSISHGLCGTPLIVTKAAFGVGYGLVLRRMSVSQPARARKLARFMIGYGATFIAFNVIIGGK